MRKITSRFQVFLLIGCVSLAGCATTRPRPAQTTDLSNQVQTLQTELQAKDREIQELQAQLDSTQRSLQRAPQIRSGEYAGRAPAVNFKPSQSSMIRVPGVTPEDLQRALARAGLHPGPVDGRIGRKTRVAIKEFQRKHSLKADGVVGEKTWSLLKSS